MYSVSPFVPAILFTTAAGTVTPTIKQAVTGLTVTAEPGTVELGGSVSIVTKLNGTINPADSDADVLVRPDACIYNVSAETPAGDGPATKPAKPVQLNARTRVDNYGVLHVQKTGLKPGDVITVTATSTYVNPSGATVPYTGIATVTIE